MLKLPIPALLLAVAITITAAFAGDTVRPGLENIEYSLAPAADLALVDAIGKPLLEGYDVEAALQDWFDRRLFATKNRADMTNAKWKKD